MWSVCGVLCSFVRVLVIGLVFVWWSGLRYSVCLGTLVFCVLLWFLGFFFCVLGIVILVFVESFL